MAKDKFLISTLRPLLSVFLIPALLLGCSGGSMSQNNGSIPSDAYQMKTYTHNGTKYWVGLNFKKDTGPVQLLIQPYSERVMTSSNADKKEASTVGFAYLRANRCKLGFKVTAADFDWNGRQHSWHLISKVIMNKAFYDGKLPGCPK